MGGEYYEIKVDGVMSNPLLLSLRNPKGRKPEWILLCKYGFNKFILRISNKNLIYNSLYTLLKTILQWQRK